ncbi:MAG: hypothetical protein IKV35_05010, partial [Clostridia bacterium]|nr:hypothetical protein [Clostridia bacterium]
IKEKTYSKEERKATPKEQRTTFGESLAFTLKDKPFLIWLCNIFIMNIGLQLFLSGINEFFSTSGMNMTFVMASCFVPVPFTIFIYNHFVKKFGLSFGFRYILAVFSLGMALMIFCPMVPVSFQYPYAIGCSLIVSFAIGAFFAVTYTVPSQRAAIRQEENKSASSMYFAIQGLFEGTSAGIASGVVLVFLKKSKEIIHFDLVPYMTVIVAGFCMTAFAFSFLLPKTIRSIGKTSVESGE